MVKGHLGKTWGARPSPRLSQLGLRTSVLGHSSRLTPTHTGNKYTPSSLDLGIDLSTMGNPHKHLEDSWKNIKGASGMRGKAASQLHPHHCPPPLHRGTRRVSLHRLIGGLAPRKSHSGFEGYKVKLKGCTERNSPSQSGNTPS